MIARRTLLAGLAMLATAQAPAPVAVPAPKPLPRIALETTAGRIVIELETVKAPITAANFLRYVDLKRLDGERFYRTVKLADHYGFIQFGASAEAKRLLPPIKHEPTTLSGLSHTNGTISIARYEPGTARGDFTISVGDQRYLDANPRATGDNQGFAAFGRVVEGMDVVEAIQSAPVDPAKLENGAFKGEVPVAPIVLKTARRVMTP